MTSEMIPSFFANLPSSWEDELPYLKLKYGLADLEDSQQQIAERTYFLSDAAPSLEMLRRLTQLFLRAKHEKQLKSRLLILSQEEESSLYAGLSDEEKREVRIITTLSEREKAILTKGARAGVLLHDNEAVAVWLREILAFQLPVIVPKTPRLMEDAGHTPLYIDTSRDDEIINALVKMEGSDALRAHIETLQREEADQE